MLRGLLDVLFPLRCASCRDGPWPFCAPCRAGLVTLLPPGCRRCGMPWEEEIARCRECPPEDVAAARAPFLYAGPAREALLRLKFGGWRAVAEAVGASMAAVTPVAPDLVTWVPLSPARRAQRGYDQSRSLATVVARELGVPARPLLRRTVDTLPQSSRTGEERRRAMRGAFRAAAGAASNAAGTVLLVDDVLTTGATAAECARHLQSASGPVLSSRGAPV